MLSFSSSTSFSSCFSLLLSPLLLSCSGACSCSLFFNGFSLSFFLFFFIFVFVILSSSPSKGLCCILFRSSEFLLLLLLPFPLRLIFFLSPPFIRRLQVLHILLFSHSHFFSSFLIPSISSFLLSFCPHSPFKSPPCILFPKSAGLTNEAGCTSSRDGRRVSTGGPSGVS